MKQFFLCALLSAGLLACNSDNDDAATEGGTAPLPTNVDNVEGTIPDTTRGTTLNTPMEIDSISGRDSLPR